MRSNVYYDQENWDWDALCYVRRLFANERKKREKKNRTEACRNAKRDRNTNENQRQWKLGSQNLFAPDEKRRMKDKGMAEKTNLYIMLFAVVSEETSREMKTKRRKKWPYKSIPLTRYLRDCNPLFIYQRFAQELNRKWPAKAAGPFSYVICDRVFVWHWMEHTSGHRWNNKTWAQAAELRHNLLRCIECSLFIFIPVAVVSSLISHEISAQNTECAVCPNHHAITPESPVTHYLHIKLCTKIMWKPFLHARV